MVYHRSWIMWSPYIYSHQQTSDLWSRSYSSRCSLSLKAGQDWCPCGKTENVQSPLRHLSDLVETSVYLMRTTHLGKGNLLCSVYWIKCSSHSETPWETQPSIHAPHSPVILTHINHHGVTPLTRRSTCILYGILLINWCNMGFVYLHFQATQFDGILELVYFLGAIT